ncbi:uncharacterized protein EKO05_0007070 [Ascochyta rabiei]|uniref:Uncharacterized protein n=1 Tax=Didymella rabiei TaxID=5454 RepID=A0A163G794_DIDRA|nr:uncharacterized protein EKO05_0007070 [Ascochyta rabiei]KZM24719.1 hypothetical protein ST47_g4182 [Ascochyta rabiei]UPX16681.1 hypothetical protein EKO05_0007070 [Ascochyta rabiei]
MDNTTLHTFLFQCPAALRSVDLLGSWDNFSKRYSLHLDTRGGPGTWKGCFTFSDIFCDGDLDMLSPKRDSPLKMGGTYWYYYEVDGDKECHNHSQPSTTVCPLLPGQSLNVLEIPIEERNRSSSESSTAFTRNPKDRFLTPVPPGKPLPSPRPGSSNREAYALPLPSPWAPKSATHAPADHFLSPSVSRHARSASASPLLPSTPLFMDFKDLKEKFASKRARSRSRSSPDVREMKISAPLLISTTADGVLPTYQTVPLRSPMNFSRPHRSTPPPLSIPTITKDFSPLTSHPVDTFTDAQPFIAELPANEMSFQRRQSYMPLTVVTDEFDVEPGRHRANSADTRRTKRSLYANDPWVSSPRSQHEFDNGIQQAREVQFYKPAPVLWRPIPSLASPAADERPSSSHGGVHSQTLHEMPLEKGLPALPRYLTPAPLFACNTYPLEEATPIEETEAEDTVTEDILRAYEDEEEPIVQISEKQRSHFSTWSSFDSYVTSDDEGVTSPIFSSATSVSSDAGSPLRQSVHYSFAEHAYSKAYDTTTIDEVDEDDEEEEVPSHRISTPPQLDLNTLRLSTISFSSDLFNLDIQHAEAMPRRQAACFGFGFSGYSLPEDATRSKETIHSEVTLRPKRISVQRESSTSQLDLLVDGFGYLGDAVV